MSKPVCIFLSGLFIGAFIVIFCKSTVTNIEERGILLHDKYVKETTEKGQECQTITKWGHGLVDERTYTGVMNVFLRQKYQLRFLDVYPDEYKLVSYKKIEELNSFKETLIFASTDTSKKEAQFRYDITCDYVEDRLKLKCKAKGEVERISCPKAMIRRVFTYSLNYMKTYF